MPDTPQDTAPLSGSGGGPPPARLAGLIVGSAGFVFLGFVWQPSAPAGADPDALAATGAVAFLMAVWWMTEAVPIPVTSLLPLVLLPLLAGPPFDLARVAANYGDWQVFLFFGGFLLAIALEDSGVHRRMALLTVRAIGTRPHRIVLGFMVASAFLSMWISNTATALMMLPIGAAVVNRFRDRPRFGQALMLGIAYGASIGGVATPIGTPPNIAFMGVYGSMFPQAPEIGFASWMAFGLTLVVVMLPAAWLVLVRGLEADEREAGGVLREELRRLGAMDSGETRALGAFAATALLWILRQDIAVGAIVVPGWSRLLPGAAINDGVVAMGMGIALFLLPSGQGGPVLRWDSVERRMPWGILLLFGGGFALADAVGGSGLSGWIGGAFGFLEGAHPVLLVASAATLLTFLTEITSNTATAQVMLPLSAAIAVSTLGVHPLLVMLPVTVAASFAFMLPVATPPNAVVYGSGAVPMAAMIRYGLWLNLIGIIVLTVVCSLLAPLIFGYSTGGGPPTWAG